MSFILEKPYTEKEKVDFIAQHNHVEGLEIVETSKALYALYPWEKLENDVVIDNTKEYEEEKAKAEKERISHLKCTKRVLMLCLQEYGLTYQALKDLLATNEQAQMEWDLCIELERNNPLLDIMGAELGITPEQIDKIFMYANGEIELKELGGK